MRDIQVVISNIERQLPRSEQVDYRAAFDSLRSSAAYSAPEQIYMWWQELQLLIHSMVGEYPTKDWHFEVISELSTVPVAQIRRDVAKYLEQKNAS